MSADFRDILYSVSKHVARITINRPDKLNSVTAETLRELEVALETANADDGVGVVVLTGAGDRAFCAGADVSWQKDRKLGQGGSGAPTPPYLMLARCLKPVIARVNGYAIGGGHHTAYFCDFTIAAEHAVFGQSEPRVAFPASGTPLAYLTRIVGHKRAREIWMLGRRYSAQTMYEWGLVNAVVPMARLDEEVEKWCEELLAVSPTCLKIYKASFLQEWQDLIGQSDFLKRQWITEEFWKGEQREGVSAFMEKRRPDFSRFRVSGETGVPPKKD